MKTKQDAYSISYAPILDAKGNVDRAREPKLSDKNLESMYATMVLTREFDKKILALQRQGRIGTAVTVTGQEAAQIGVAHAMQKKDWLVPSFRETAAYLQRGLPLQNILLYYGGDERGSIPAKGEKDLPASIPVGSQPLHAVGIAMSMRIKGEAGAVVTFFGDGATSEGEFHEAMNFAGVFNAPVVFVCQNNQFAISTRHQNQTAAESYAQKAIAYGFKGVHVDGNDILGVYAAAREALTKARNGGGPTLIECYTYRLGDHTTSDDATRYREEKERKEWEKRDPIIRFKAYLSNKGVWNAKKEAQLAKRVAKKIDDALRAFESTPAPSPKDLFAYTYKEMPQTLKDEYTSVFEK
ncbi:pyruvate dehydrogenase (acetyl-transferring) E1 component subunit alpha [archaeon CG10_big_fil_rev_8_21_14_0_10_43_11]|nr:MAG: pyruvate dehydrogenase (acetyl-transferring) E1 component subunit alpha [archaeon CG10_big_fil_rev_8_21_14_0_10_43_11]